MTAASLGSNPYYNCNAVWSNVTIDGLNKAEFRQMRLEPIRKNHYVLRAKMIIPKMCVCLNTKSKIEVLMVHHKPRGRTIFNMGMHVMCTIFEQCNFLLKFYF